MNICHAHASHLSEFLVQNSKACYRILRKSVQTMVICRHSPTNTAVSWHFDARTPLSPVYTIQPVVNPVVKPVWQPGKMFVYTIQLLSNRLSTGLTNGCIVYTAGCQTSCTTRFDNRLNEQWLFVQHGCQTVFVKPVVQRGLTTGWTNSAVHSTRLSNRLSNPFDNRSVWQPVVSCITGF